MAIEFENTISDIPEGPNDLTPEPIIETTQLPFKRRLLKAGLRLAPILALGLPLGGYMGIEFYVSEGQRWKANWDNNIHQYQPPEKAAICFPALIPYEVGDGDSLSLIVRKSGMIPTIFDVSQDVRNIASPFFARVGIGIPDGPIPLFPPYFAYDYLNELNPGLQDREGDNYILYPHNDTTIFPDTLLLPETSGVIEFVKEEGQFPFPNAPEDMFLEAVKNDPTFMDTIDERVQAVFDGNRQTLQSIKDACVVKIYQRERELTADNIKQILAEYEVQYGRDSRVGAINEYYSRPYITKINSIIEASGVEVRISDDLTDYTIYRPVINQQIPGLANSVAPFILKVGNENYPSSLTQGIGMFDYEFENDFNYLLPQFYEIPENTQADYAEFMRLGRQLLLDSRYDYEYINYQQDLRIPYLMHIISKNRTWEEAYLMLIRASLTGNVKEVEAAYYENMLDFTTQGPYFLYKHVDGIETFYDLLTGNVTTNSPFDYYRSDQNEDRSQVMWWQDVLKIADITDQFNEDLPKSFYRQYLSYTERIDQPTVLYNAPPVIEDPFVFVSSEEHGFTNTIASHESTFNSLPLSEK